VLILVAISAACIVAAVWTFGRRDLAA
jgi:hypothetical protein